jgi:hypothetical protein
MKSTIEYSEAEFIALVTLAEKFTDRIFRLVEAEQSLSHEYRRSLREEAPLGGSDISPVVADDVDTYVASMTSPMDSNEFGFNQQSSRMKDIPVPQDTPIVPKKDGELVARGHQIMAEVSERWQVNLGVEDGPQPDRVEMMRELANGPSAGAVLMYLSEKGGLLHGLDPIINLLPGETETSRRARVNVIGSTMCQIGSIFFPDIAQMYEHVDIYRKKKVK